MNETLNIQVGHSIGPYLLGMARNEVWSQFRYPITSFYKTNESKYRTDDISLLGIHVHYNENEKSEFIEAWTSVQYNTPKLIIEGVLLNGQSMKDIKALCELLPYTFEPNDCGYHSKEGIGFYCHNFDSEDSFLDGVYIQRKRS